MSELRIELIGTDTAAFEWAGQRHVVTRKRGGPTFKAARLAVVAGCPPTSAISLWRGSKCVGTAKVDLGTYGAYDLQEPDDGGLRFRRYRPFAREDD